MVGTQHWGVTYGVIFPVVVLCRRKVSHTVDHFGGGNTISSIVGILHTTSNFFLPLFFVISFFKAGSSPNDHRSMVDS
jgi:surface polysaccharide O-acyltransferase-like enzyme